MQKVFSCHDAIMYSHNLIVHNCCVCIAWRVIKCNQCQKRSCYFLNVIGPCAIMMSWHGNTIHNSEMDDSFSWNFHQWLHWKLSFWQLPMQPLMKISSKWWYFHFSDYWPFVWEFTVYWWIPSTNVAVMQNFDGCFTVSLVINCRTKGSVAVEMICLNAHRTSPSCH